MGLNYLYKHTSGRCVLVCGEQVMEKSWAARAGAAMERGRAAQLQPLCLL